MVQHRVFASLALALFMLIAASATAAQAQPTTQPGMLTPGQVQQMLDRPIGPLLGATGQTVTLKDNLLIDVLDRLEGEGDWLRAPGWAFARLPYDRQTRVSLQAPADTTVRKLLDLLLGSQGLTYRIAESDRGYGTLTVAPSEELIRIGRRATIDELQLLHVLHTMRITDWSKPLAEQLAKAMGRPVNFQFDLTRMDAATAYKRFNESLPGMPPNTAAGLLDQFCRQQRCAWRVDGNTIVVLERIKQAMHQLDRRVAVRWSQTPLEDALTQISRLAGLTAQFQPGMAEGPEAAAHAVTLLTPDQPIVQILESLSAKTGIGYEVREDSIYFFGPRRMDPVVGMVSLPSRTGLYNYQMFLRKSMLSKEAQEALEATLQKAAEDMSTELTQSPLMRKPWPKSEPPK